MKRALFTLLIFGASLTPADVVKPNGFDRARGKTNIGGIEVDYIVQERGGWIPHSESSIGLFTGTKTFSLEYAVDPELFQSNQQVLSDIKVDTQKKCRELGRMEFSAFDQKSLGKTKGNFITEIKGIKEEGNQVVAACRIILNFQIITKEMSNDPW